MAPHSPKGSGLTPKSSVQVLARLRRYSHGRADCRRLLPQELSGSAVGLAPRVCEGGQGAGFAEAVAGFAMGDRGGVAEVEGRGVR
ncbi:hypothetical protein [Streptomyces sp. NPDC055140]